MANAIDSNAISTMRDVPALRQCIAASVHRTGRCMLPLWASVRSQSLLASGGWMRLTAMLLVGPMTAKANSREASQ